MNVKTVPCPVGFCQEIKTVWNRKEPQIDPQLTINPNTPAIFVQFLREIMFQNVQQ